MRSIASNPGLKVGRAFARAATLFTSAAYKTNRPRVVGLKHDYDEAPVGLKLPFQPLQMRYKGSSHCFRLVSQAPAREVP